MNRRRPAASRKIYVLCTPASDPGWRSACRSWNLAEPDHRVDIGVRAEAAGWDGVLLWDHVHGGPVEIGRALEVVAEHRAPDAGPLAVAVSHSEILSDDEMAAYASLGLTWVLVAAWIDELDRLIDLAATVPR